MQHLFNDATSVYRWCTADSDVAAVRVCVSVYIDSSTVSHLQMRLEICHVLVAWAIPCGIIWNIKASGMAVELRYMYRSGLVIIICRVIHKQQ